MDKGQFILEQTVVASNVGLVFIVMTLVVLLLSKTDILKDKES